MSLVAPFAAFIPAEKLHVSGVLAVVTTGLILAHRSPRDQDPQARLVEGAVWNTLQFVLEGVVFMLIGLQLRWILTEVDSDAGRAGRGRASSCWAWSCWCARHGSSSSPSWCASPRGAAQIKPTAGQMAVVSWAGMRGVVSLAAALSLPLAIGRRDLLLFLTVVVIIGTLVAQGLTLPWVIRRLERGAARPSARRPPAGQRPGAGHRGRRGTPRRARSPRSPSRPRSWSASGAWPSSGRSSRGSAWPATSPPPPARPTGACGPR